MRIHLSLEASHFAAQPVAGPSSGPLAQLGGELVLIELQGELGWEGNKEGGVVGVIGLDRPDKPTLHLGEHHLLHGKFATLAKPLAVIRRAVAPATTEGGVDGVVEGDPDEEEDLEEEEEAEAGKAKNGQSKPRAKRRKSSHANEEDEGPLFPPDRSESIRTPPRRRPQDSSSPIPFEAPSSNKGYSSELDHSSPIGPTDKWGGQEDDDDDHEDENGGHGDHERDGDSGKKRARSGGADLRRTLKPERTRVYEVVGVVRRKVVFALRPEPIVTATVLPE